MSTNFTRSESCESLKFKPDSPPSIMSHCKLCFCPEPLPPKAPESICVRSYRTEECRQCPHGAEEHATLISATSEQEEVEKGFKLPIKTPGEFSPTTTVSNGVTGDTSPTTSEAQLLGAMNTARGTGSITFQSQVVNLEPFMSQSLHASSSVSASASGLIIEPILRSPAHKEHSRLPIPSEKTAEASVAKLETGRGRIPTPYPRMTSMTALETIITSRFQSRSPNTKHMPMLCENISEEVDTSSITPTFTNTTFRPVASTAPRTSTIPILSVSARKKFVNASGIEKSTSLPSKSPPSHGEDQDFTITKSRNGKRPVFTPKQPTFNAPPADLMTSPSSVEEPLPTAESLGRKRAFAECGDLSVSLAGHDFRGEPERKKRRPLIEISETNRKEDIEKQRVKELPSQKADRRLGRLVITLFGPVQHELKDIKKLATDNARDVEKINGSLSILENKMEDVLGGVNKVMEGMGAIVEVMKMIRKRKRKPEDEDLDTTESPPKRSATRKSAVTINTGNVKSPFSNPPSLPNSPTRSFKFIRPAKGTTNVNDPYFTEKPFYIDAINNSSPMEAHPKFSFARSQKSLGPIQSEGLSAFADVPPGGIYGFPGEAGEFGHLVEDDDSGSENEEDDNREEAGSDINHGSNNEEEENEKDVHGSEIEGEGEDGAEDSGNESDTEESDGDESEGEDKSDDEDIEEEDGSDKNEKKASDSNTEEHNIGMEGETEDTEGDQNGVDGCDPNNKGDEEGDGNYGISSSEEKSEDERISDFETNDSYQREAMVSPEGASVDKAASEGEDEEDNTADITAELPSPKISEDSPHALPSLGWKKRSIAIGSESPINPRTPSRNRSSTPTSSALPPSSRSSSTSGLSASPSPSPAPKKSALATPSSRSARISRMPATRSKPRRVTFQSPADSELSSISHPAKSATKIPARAARRGTPTSHRARRLTFMDTVETKDSDSDATDDGSNDVFSPQNKSAAKHKFSSPRKISLVLSNAYKQAQGTSENGISPKTEAEESIALEEELSEDELAMHIIPMRAATPHGRSKNLSISTTKKTALGSAATTATEREFQVFTDSHSPTLVNTHKDGSKGTNHGSDELEMVPEPVTPRTSRIIVTRSVSKSGRGSTVAPAAFGARESISTGGKNRRGINRSLSMRNKTGNKRR